MTWPTCSRLEELRSALTDGYWPQACAPDLRAHVESCPRCAQEVLITQHLQQARASAVDAVRPATPSLLWWRAQTRRRYAAIERAGRPLAAAQVFALVIVLAALVGVIASNWHSLLERALSTQTTPTFSLAGVLGDWGLTPFIFAVTLITALGGVVLYLTTERH
jgi:anti-sigma factor RsiW